MSSSLTDYQNLPIIQLIDQLNATKGSQITFEDLKTELSRNTTEGEVITPIYNLQFKEDDDLCLIYNSPSYQTEPDNIEKDKFITELEDSCRSTIIDKNTLKPIVSQFNRILYNEESIEFLKDKDWSHVTVQRCYEGTLLTVFNHNDNWYVSTRRCLDAKDSTWIAGNSYYDLFVESMDNIFTFDELNKDFCYHFVLVHSKNKNIVSYTWLGKDYAELLHVMTTEKYTLKEVNHKINENVRYVDEVDFDSFETLQKDLQVQNDTDIKYQKITTEGYILRYYFGEVHNSTFINMKLQTDIYKTLMGLKPNNSNIHQCFLELYQNDTLNEFLPFFSRYGGEIIRRIHQSMRNISKEVLDLYHATRNKKNEEMYNNLTNVYKKCIYEIHGQYIKSRKQDFSEEGIDTKTVGTPRAINVFHVYKYLKELPSKDLRQLYYDRMNLLENENMTFLNKGCINTMTQSSLMFKHKIKKQQSTDA